jgi:hypothetical protein
MTLDEAKKLYRSPTRLVGVLGQGVHRHATGAPDS